MAEAPVTTTKAPTPTAPNLPSGGVQPYQGWDAPAIDAFAKSNFQFENLLAGDKETLVNDMANYNRTLLGLGETENKGYKALGGRALRQFAGNFGEAKGERQELAGQYTNRRAGLAERTQEALNRVGAQAQKERGNLQESIGLINQQSVGRAEKRTTGRALEAPTGAAGAGAPGGAYPAATATVNAAFPGGTPEQVAYGKAAAKGYTYDEFKKAWNAGTPLVVGEAPQRATRRARGGPITPGNAYLVGERGPELVVPKTPGRVLPNSRLAAIRKATRSRRG